MEEGNPIYKDTGTGKRERTAQGSRIINREEKTRTANDEKDIILFGDCLAMELPSEKYERLLKETRDTLNLVSDGTSSWCGRRALNKDDLHALTVHMARVRALVIALAAYFRVSNDVLDREAAYEKEAEDYTDRYLSGWEGD